MQKIPLSEVLNLLDGLKKEQEALHKQKQKLLDQKDAIDKELKEMEVRFHRGAGGVLALNHLCNLYGEFPHLKSGVKIMEAYEIPVVPEDQKEQHLAWRTGGPEGLEKDELTRRRKKVYERQADDWIEMLDRRDNDEDAGPGDTLGPGGSAVGEGRPEREELVAGEPDQREPADGRPAGR